MYMGHVAIGMGARRVNPRVPLWCLIVASIAPDIADALGGFTPARRWIAQFSHTLYGIAVLAVFMGLLVCLITKNGRGGLLAAALVVSHLLADFLTTHIALWPRGPVVGLGLYRYPVGDFFLELVAILIGIYFYRRSLNARRTWRTWLPVAMAVCLIAFQITWDSMLLA